MKQNKSIANQIFQDFKSVPSMTRNSIDSVFDKFLEVVSIYAAGNDIFLMSTAAFIGIKPYISLSIEVSGNEEIGTDYTDISDSAAIGHESCFRGCGDKYANKNVNVRLKAFWIEPDGTQKTVTKETEAVVNLLAALEKLQIDKPRAADAKRTCVVYGTYTASLKFDYQYKENKKSGNTVKAMLPLKGYLELGAEWYPTAIDFTEGNKPKLYMLLSSGGAVCYEKDLSKIFTLSEEKIDFSLPDDDWGSTIDISRLSSATTLDLYFSFTAKLKNKFYPLQEYTVRATVICKNALADDPLIKIAVIEPIYIYWDCIAANTLIKMYPQGEKEVSQMKTGDKIIDEIGGIRTVKCCIESDAESIYKLTTSSGKVLAATANHVIKTHSGFVKMKDLTKCNYVLVKCNSNDGFSAEDISSITVEQYNGKVYSIELEEGNTLICNGILSGDSKAINVINCNWSTEIIEKRAYLHDFIVKATKRQ